MNLSTPTVINTELIPLDESFWVEASGLTEQWYYDNSGQYAPNRQTVPLTLIPRISVYDADLRTTYTPTWYNVRWFENAWNSSTSQYEEHEITNTVDSQSAEYVKSGNTLIVKKNVSYTRAVSIRCEAEYIDPRDSGLTNIVEDTVKLQTNRNATVLFPKLDVACPSSQAYNPLADGSSQFVMEAVIDDSVVDTSSVTYSFEWWGIANNTEVKADTLPWYVSGQDTDTLTIDAMYGEHIRVILRGKDNQGNYIPQKVYRSVDWRIPDIDTQVVSEKGGAVRSSTSAMEFSTVVNAMHQTLDDAKKKAHLMFNWKTRRNNTSTEQDAGWGQRVRIAADRLRNVIGASASMASTLVYAYVYLMGPFEKVTDGGSDVTDGGEAVYDRPVN